MTNQLFLKVKFMAQFKWDQKSISQTILAYYKYCSIGYNRWLLDDKVQKKMLQVNVEFTQLLEPDWHAVKLLCLKWHQWTEKFCHMCVFIGIVWNHSWGIIAKNMCTSTLWVYKENICNI